MSANEHYHQQFPVTRVIVLILQTFTSQFFINNYKFLMDSSGKKLGRPQTKALQSEEEDSRAGDE
jgi:hypothetical protein